MTADSEEEACEGVSAERRPESQNISQLSLLHTSGKQLIISPANIPGDISWANRKLRSRVGS